MIGISPQPLTLRELRPMARGAWSRAAWQILWIGNTIPRFSKDARTIRLQDCDPYALFDAADGPDPDLIPYNPAVLQAAQAQIDAAQEEAHHGG